MNSFLPNMTTFINDVYVIIPIIMIAIAWGMRLCVREICEWVVWLTESMIVLYTMVNVC